MAYALSTQTSNRARSGASRDFERMQRALDWLGDNFDRQPQPSLARTAAEVGLSEFHFQRLFTRWVGLSPKQYVQFLSLDRAKCSLDRSRSVLEASFDSGLSGPGRLHDLFVSIESVTPGEYKSRGAGIEIDYGFHPSPFGECLLMQTERGVCALAFSSGQSRDEMLAELSRGWEGARIRRDDAASRIMVERIFDSRDGDECSRLRALVRGTGFQIKVWQTLLGIPSGALTSYRDVAQRVGSPGASRAVGTAVGANRIAYLIPCHRVIRGNGSLGGYRWGRGRKLAMLWREAAERDAIGRA